MGCGASVTKESPQGDGFYKVFWIASDQEKQSCSVSATLMPASRIQVRDECSSVPMMSAAQSPTMSAAQSSMYSLYADWRVNPNNRTVGALGGESTDHPAIRGALKLGAAGQGD